MSWNSDMPGQDSAECMSSRSFKTLSHKLKDKKREIEKKKEYRREKRKMNLFT